MDRVTALNTTLDVLAESRRVLEATPPSAAFTSQLLTPGIDLPNLVRAWQARYALAAGRHDQALAFANDVPGTAQSEYRYATADQNPLWSVFTGLRYFSAQSSLRTAAESGDARVARLFGPPPQASLGGSSIVPVFTFATQTEAYAMLTQDELFVVEQTLCRRLRDTLSIMLIRPRSIRSRRAAALGLAAVVLCAACNDTSQPTDPRPVRPSSVPPSLQRLEASVGSGERVVGMRVTVMLQAFGTSGEALSTESARVRSSDTSVAAVEHLLILPVRNLATAELVRTLQVAFVLASEGASELEFTLGHLTKTIAINVLPLPEASTALAVDSFTVVSYKSGTMLIYVPLLKLREPTGAQHVEVTAVEFTVPGRSTRLCRASITYAPGQLAHLNGQDPYLYSNDLIFGTTVDSPFPNGLATARVLLRETSGRTGAIFVTAPFTTAPTTAPMPPQAFPGIGWAC